MCRERMGLVVLKISLTPTHTRLFLFVLFCLSLNVHKFQINFGVLVDVS